MKIATFGSYAMMDIGDDAMLYRDLDYIINIIGVPIGDIRIITRNIKAIVKYLRELGINEEACVQETPQVIDDTLEWCDKVLITGGGTINTRRTVASLNRMHEFVARCRNRGKEVFLSGQTIGPLGLNQKQDRLAREIIEYCSVVTVRDFNRSLEYAKLIGSTIDNIYQTVDDAWGLEGCEVKVPDIDKFLDEDVIGFNANNYAFTATDEYVYIATKVCDTIISKYNKKILFIHQGLSLPYLDAGISRRIYNQSNHKDKMLCNSFVDVSCREFKGIISRLDGLLASRYHSLVFAAASGIPYVGICADFYSWLKQIGFSEKLGMDKCLIEANDISLDNILNKFDMSINNDYSGKLEEFNEHKNDSMEMFSEFIK